MFLLPSFTQILCYTRTWQDTSQSLSLLDTLTLKATYITPPCPGTPHLAAQLIRDNFGVFWYVRRLLLQPESGYLQILSWRFSSEKLLGTWWSCRINRNHKKKCGPVNKDCHPQILCVLFCILTKVSVDLLSCSPPCWDWRERGSGPPNTAAPCQNSTTTDLGSSHEHTVTATHTCRESRVNYIHFFASWSKAPYLHYICQKNTSRRPVSI